MTLENTLDAPLRKDVTDLFARAPVPQLSSALSERTAEVAGRLKHVWAGDLLPPESIVGPFVIGEVIGSGGQATVYRARGEDGRDVALKVPRPELVSRLVREAQILFHLDHPRVVRIEKAVIDADIPYIATEFLAAGSLADRLRSCGGALPESEVRVLAEEILEALEYAHAKGVVHRDLKPANVLFDDEGRVKVADFGIGRLRLVERLGVAGTLVSSDGTIFAGTPLYMAPEQELPGEPVDGRADLYALGKLLYHVLTGRSPRTVQPVGRRFPKLAHWDAFLFRLLEDLPDDRFPNAEDARAALDAIHEGEGGTGAVAAEPPAGKSLPPRVSLSDLGACSREIVRPSDLSVLEISRALTWFAGHGRGVRLLFLGDDAPVGFAEHVSSYALIHLLEERSPWKDSVLLICGDFVVGAIRLTDSLPPNRNAAEALSRITKGVSVVLAPGSCECWVGNRGRASDSFPPRRLLATLRERGLVAVERTESQRQPLGGLWLAIPSLLVGVVLGVAATSSLGQGLGLLAFAVAAAIALSVAAKRWVRPRVYS